MKRELELLREKMRETGVDACLIPTSDFHGSEYVGDYFKCREYISGFTGSAGTLVVTLDEAGLWTDGRYFLQAAKQFFQVGTGWQEPVNGSFQLCLILQSEQGVLDRFRRIFSKNQPYPQLFSEHFAGCLVFLRIFVYNVSC